MAVAQAAEMRWAPKNATVRYIAFFETLQAVGRETVVRRR